MFHFLLIVSLVLFSIWIYLQHHRKWKPLETIPGPPGYPIIGNLHMFMGSIEKATKNVLRLINSNDRLIKLWFGPFPFVFVLNSKDADLILKSSKNVNKSKHYVYWKPFIGDGLFTISDGSQFKRNKKLIMPSLSLNNVKKFFDVFNKQTEKMIEVLGTKTGREFDISSDLTKCLMIILLETVLGYNGDDLQKKSNVIAGIGGRIVTRGLERVYKFWMASDFLFWLLGYKKSQDKEVQQMNEVADQIINERRKNRKTSNLQWTVFIDTLIDATDENGPIYSHKQIRDEVLTIIVAGQDTLASTLGFSLCLLGLHNDVQEKLYEEVVEKLGKHNSDITYDDIKEMVYLGQVVQETLRLYPTATIVSKVAMKDIMLADGQIIPKDTNIMLSLYHIHRNRGDYPYPEQFNPDNFSPEKTCSRHPYSFIPFSAGTRACVGQAYAYILLQLILAKLILNFKVYSRIKQEDFRLSWEVILRRPDGFLVTLEPRINNNCYQSTFVNK